MPTSEMLSTGSSTAWVEDEFSSLDAIAQSELVKAGQLSAAELLDATIARVEKINPQINAIASTNFDQARERACAMPDTGLFAGVPTLLKDLMAYPGLPFECGSRMFAGQVANTGSDYTRAIDAAGLVVLGKSTTSELGLLGTTETLAYGATRNPWDLSRSTGGSSGGAVAAVASGLVPVAHASDGGGSIRGPASFCGVFGFKPSRGRHLTTGPASESPFGRILSEHCVSRSVRDSAAWLVVTERRDGAMPFPRIGYVTEAINQRLRIGVYRQTPFGRAPDREIAEALEHTAKLCDALGHEMVECSGPQFNAPATSDAFFLLAGATAAGLFAQLQLAFNDFDLNLFEPFTRVLAEKASNDMATAVPRALSTFAEAEAAANRCFNEFDVLLCPTVPFTAFSLGRIGPNTPVEDIIAFTQELAGYTAIASIAGWCAMSVPLHMSPEGLPIGMHFAAPMGQDAQLLGLAYALEAASPWQQRKPGARETYGSTP